MTYRTTVILLLAAVTTGAPVAGAPCNDDDKQNVICGFQGPEDLAVLPGNRAVVVSELGSVDGSRSGGLALMLLPGGTRQVLATPADVKKGVHASGWGDPNCAPPAGGFAPHGIDLRKRSDGKLALAVVQHFERESIELFELTGAGTQWQAQWRGCVIGPTDAWFNDVVILPQGDLIVSHMQPRSIPFVFEREPGSKHPEGTVYHWTAHTGFSEVPGARGLMPNGVALSSDASMLFVNYTLMNEVRRIDLTSGKVTGHAEVPSPDNSTWSADGSLVVASVTAVDEKTLASCRAKENCPPGFRLVRLDPKTMSVTPLREGSPEMVNGGTVGLQVGDEVFVGSYQGDRIGRVRIGSGSGRHKE